MHFSKDFAGLSEVEADGLIEIIKSDDVTYSADAPPCWVLLCTASHKGFRGWTKKYILPSR